MCLIILALSPVIAAVYRDHQLLALMASLAYLPIAFALQAPLWVFFRRMDYRRQRSLQAIQPAGRLRRHRPAGGGHRPGGVEPDHRPGGRLRGRGRRHAPRHPVPPGACATTAGWRRATCASRARSWSTIACTHGHRPGSDPHDQAPRRPGRRRLHHPGGDADALHRPRRPDRDRHHLPRDLRDPGPAPGAGGAVPEVQPGDAAVGAALRGRGRPVRPRPRPLRPGPDAGRPRWCCSRAWPSWGRSPSSASTGSRSSAPTATPARRRWRPSPARWPSWPWRPRACCSTAFTGSCWPDRRRARALRGARRVRAPPAARRALSPDRRPDAASRSWWPPAAAVVLRADPVGAAPDAGSGDRRAGRCSWPSTPSWRCVASGRWWASCWARCAAAAGVPRAGVNAGGRRRCPGGCGPRGPTRSRGRGRAVTARGRPAAR